MNTINNNISFGAKLDYSNVIGNRSRFAKIANFFEEKTKQHPNDIFMIETNDIGGIYFHPDYSSNRLKRVMSWDKGEISPITTDELTTLSAKKVADVFKRLFVMRKKADNMLVDYFNMENKYALTRKVNTEIIDDFFNKFCDLRKSFVENKVKEDKVLKTLNNIDVI